MTIPKTSRRYDALSSASAALPGTVQFETIYEGVMPLVGAHDLIERLEQTDLLTLDCRHDLAQPELGRQQYQQSHIPGARFAHLDQDLAGRTGVGTGRHPLPDRQTFQRQLLAWGINPNTHVVAYDASGGCYAARAWWLLRWAGHRKVSLLNGGWQAWRDADGPVSAAIPQAFAVHETDLTDAPALTRSINADGLAMIVNDPGLAASRIVMDARSPDRYRGENETMDPIAGHIPGAINRCWKDNLDDDGQFKRSPQLRQAFEAILDGRPARTIISYCGSGVTACHNVFAIYLAGLGESTLYPGSWSEWITQPR